MIAANVVKYEADIVPSALYDWIRVLSFTSRVHRLWSTVHSFLPFGFAKGRERPSEMTNKKIRDLQAQVHLLTDKLEKYKVLEVFDSMPDRGDVFPLLASLEPEEVIECLYLHISE